MSRARIVAQWPGGREGYDLPTRGCIRPRCEDFDNGSPGRYRRQNAAGCLPPGPSMRPLPHIGCNSSSLRIMTCLHLNLSEQFSLRIIFCKRVLIPPWLHLGSDRIQHRAVGTAALSSFSGLFCSPDFLMGLVQVCSVHGYGPGECHQSQNCDNRKHSILLSMTVPDYKLTSPN